MITGKEVLQSVQSIIVIKLVVIIMIIIMSTQLSVQSQLTPDWSVE